MIVLVFFGMVLVFGAFSVMLVRGDTFNGAPVLGLRMGIMTSVLVLICLYFYPEMAGNELLIACLTFGGVAYVVDGWLFSDVEDDG